MMHSAPAAATRLQPTNAAVATPLWDQLLQAIPALRSEYIQVLVFVCVPLIIFVAILIANLALRRRVVHQLGSVTFRPSFAIRTAWIFAICALIGNLFIARHQNWFLVVTNLLAAIELIRTFPRSLTIDASGLEWRASTGRVSLRWENISAFARERSSLGTEYKVYGNEDQTFTINSLENPDWKKIIQAISRGLAHRQLKPSFSRPHNFLESLHRVLLPASLLITFAGPHLPHF